MTDAEWTETTNARIRLRDDGIVEYRPNQGAVDTLETARENLAVFKQLLGERAPGPHLIFLDGLKSQSRDARIFLAQGEESRQVCNPVALVVGSRLSQVLGNVFVGLSKPRVPLKLFTRETDAVDWLKQNRP